MLMHEELEEVEPNCLWEDIKHAIMTQAHDNVPKKQIAKTCYGYPVQQSILLKIGEKPKLLEIQNHIRSSVQSFKTKQDATKPV